MDEKTIFMSSIKQKGIKMLSSITHHLLQLKNKRKKDISSQHPMSDIAFMQTEIKLPQKKTKNHKKKESLSRKFI
ncbi:MAG: hypothetical protein E7014_02720 [Alphaproteobacteria bacterium]|nr:hypothetical protein [Alphaproteobacteria bacterium]